jgi:hypothetical protein
MEEPAEGWRTLKAAAMAELIDEDRFVDLGRTGKGRKVRWMPLDVLTLLVAVLALGNHRRKADGEHL